LADVGEHLLRTILYREEKQSELAAIFAKPKPLSRRKIVANLTNRVVVSSPTSGAA
jgi:hypothetical protein